MSSPDYLEPFIGWKGLHANQAGQLFSPQEREYSDWPAGAPFEAHCARRLDHAPPVKGCSCGIYALTSFEELRAAGYNWDVAYHSPERGNCVAVIAEVSLWGRIRRGQIGCRAEFAYPQRVYVPATKLVLGRVIRDRYGCALGLIDRFTGKRG